MRSIISLLSCSFSSSYVFFRLANNEPSISPLTFASNKPWIYLSISAVRAWALSSSSCITALLPSDCSSNALLMFCLNSAELLLAKARTSVFSLTPQLANTFQVLHGSNNLYFCGKWNTHKLRVFSRLSNSIACRAFCYDNPCNKGNLQRDNCVHFLCVWSPLRSCPALSEMFPCQWSQGAYSGISSTCHRCCEWLSYSCMTWSLCGN